MNAAQKVKAKSAREWAAHVVDQVVRHNAHAKESLDRAILQADLSDRDRAFCTELVYGTLRFIPAIKESLSKTQRKKKKIDRRIAAHLWVAAYQIQYMTKVPARAAVNEAVASVKKVRREQSAFANALLRNVGPRLDDSLTDESTIDEIAKAYGLAPFAARAYVRKREPHARAILAAQCERPRLGVKVLYKHEALEVFLKEKGEPHAFVKDVHMVSGAGSPSSWPGFEDGAFIVADPGSVFVAELLNAQKNESVIDFCAAPGTKSMVLANLGAKVTSVEKEEHRAKKLHENAERLQAFIDVVVGDALEVRGEFDRVLLDAPCTGYGTLRRKPEIKLHKGEKERDALFEVQRALLAHAASCTKVGGRLVYAVCSPLPEEGEQQVAAFLAANEAFAFVSPSELGVRVAPNVFDGEGGLRLHTDLHECDAFYMAVMTRRS